MHGKSFVAGRVNRCRTQYRDRTQLRWRCSARWWSARSQSWYVCSGTAWLMCWGTLARRVTWSLWLFCWTRIQFTRVYAWGCRYATCSHERSLHKCISWIICSFLSQLMELWNCPPSHSTLSTPSPLNISLANRLSEWLPLSSSLPINWFPYAAWSEQESWMVRLFLNGKSLLLALIFR